MRARAGQWAGWAAGALALLIAAGGAASRPDGWVLGLPGWAWTFAALAALGAVAAWAGPPKGRVFLGLLPLALAVLFGVRIPGIAALAGAPLCALVLGCLAGIVAVAPPRGQSAAFLPVIALVYGLAAARVQAQVGPEGDEPHYLMVADSLLHDHDLSLERDYEEGRYRAFHPAPLAPHYRVRGRGGAIYSLHAVGLSLLVLPAYALGSYPGASYFMALVGVFVAYELRALLRDWLGGGADGVAWVLALSPPLVHYAGLVFTEVPAALIVAAVLRRARGPTRARTALAAGTALALLPWLNVRYGVLALALAFFALSARPGLRTAMAWIAPLVLSAAAIAAYHHHLYGFFDPRLVYGRRPELSLAGLPTGLPGLLFDQEFGLLPYAPVFALALPGAVALWRGSRRGALVVVGLVAAVALVAGAWPMWRGGFNPPARFLVPVVPALGLAVAARLRGGVGAAAALLVGWSLWAGALGTWDRTLVHRDREGTAPLLRAASGAEEWTRLVPGYVLQESEPDRRRLTLVWAAALVAAACVGGGVPRMTAGRVAAASLGMVAAAGIASALSTARTHGRDAVRVVGRPALAVPGWRSEARAAAVWTTAVLDWGPAYEPHRFAEGAVLGDRLALPPGRYTIEVEGEAVPSSLSPPWLESGPHGAPAALQATPDGLAGSFVVPEGRRETTLRLRSGGPFIVKEIRLHKASTFSAGSGLNP